MTSLRRGALSLCLALAGLGCGSCEGERAVPPTPVEPPAEGCGAPRYGLGELETLYDVSAADGVPAILSPDPEAVLEVAGPLLAALDDALATSRDGVPRPAAIVVQGDAWGAAARLRATGASSSDAEALVGALRALSDHLATPDSERGYRPPSVVSAVLPEAEGWREMDTEHTTLMHERAFGLRRAFRIFVRGDHEARALVSQLVAVTASGEAYLSDVVGEMEILELDDDGPTHARVLHLDRAAVGCGEVMLHEELEVGRIPDLGADTFLLDLPAPEPLATMPCARCHDDADAFSLPTRQTSVSDRLGGLISRASERRASIGLVPRAQPSAQ